MHNFRHLVGLSEATEQRFVCSCVGSHVCVLTVWTLFLVVLLTGGCLEAQALHSISALPPLTDGRRCLGGCLYSWAKSRSCSLE